MPARNGDCTRVRKRVSTSWGSIVRAVADAPLARLALKIRSSINHVCYRQIAGAALQESTKGKGQGKKCGKVRRKKRRSCSGVQRRAARTLYFALFPF